MARLTKKQIAELEKLHEELWFYGTPEKGYTDSGFWKFLPMVYTNDTNDDDNPVKPILGKGDEYLIVVGLFMLACRNLALTKSRQMRFSWFTTAFGLWHTMRGQYRRTVYQSKKEKDAFKMITQGAKIPGGGRADFMHMRLPGWLRDDNVFSGTGNTAGKLTFNPRPTDPSGMRNPYCGSTMEGLPQGPDQVRGETISLFMSDESAYQDDFAETVRALKAAVKKWIAVSTVDSGSHFNEMVLDVEKGENADHVVPDAVQRGLEILGIKWLKGQRAWKTRTGVWVLETHYTADPKKDPERDGAEWFLQEIEGYDGGVEGSAWQTEMEINYSAGGGAPVFPRVTITSPIFVGHIDPAWAMDNLRICAGYDYGTTNTSAYEVLGIDKRKRLFFLWELMEPCINLEDHCRRIIANPYWKASERTVGDWSLNNKTQWEDNKLGGVSDQFYTHGVSLTPGVRGAPVRFAIRLLGEYGWSNPDDTDKLMAHIAEDDCPGLAREVTQTLRWAKHSSEAVRRRKSNPEKMMDKNDDCFAAASYIGDTLPSPPADFTDPVTHLCFDSVVAEKRLRDARIRSRGRGVHVRS